MFEIVKKDIKAFEANHGKGILPKLYYPMFLACLLFRLECYLHKFLFARPFSYCLVRVNDFLFGIWIGPKVKVGGGLFLGHARGMVVNPETIIGDNCTILQRVTIGGPGVVIGDNVLIGAGAQIISRKNKQKGISIGNNVKIGAGTVVVDDVPDNCTVVGNPMRIL